MNYYAFEEQLNRELNATKAEARVLSEIVDDLKQQLSFTGLTTEELQGIHGLIQGQIAFISKIQNGDDVHEVYSAVDALVSLASLVSKPTD